MVAPSDEIFPSATSRRADATLDALDRAILDELRADGRISMRELAARVHVSRAQVYARVERLRAGGVIRGYRAMIDPVAAGLTTTAYVMLAIEQNAWRHVAAELRQIRYVEHLALLGGEFDVLVLVRCPDNTTLRHVVLERIQEITGVRSTRTSLLFEEIEGIGGYGEAPPVARRRATRRRTTADDAAGTR